MDTAVPTQKTLPCCILLPSSVPRLYQICCKKHFSVFSACVLKSYNFRYTHRGSIGIAPLILNLCTRWGWVFNLTIRSFYPPGRNRGVHRIRGCVGARAGVDVLGKRQTTWTYR